MHLPLPLLAHRRREQLRFQPVLRESHAPIRPLDVPAHLDLAEEPIHRPRDDGIVVRHGHVDGAQRTAEFLRRPEPVGHACGVGAEDVGDGRLVDDGGVGGDGRGFGGQGRHCGVGLVGGGFAVAEAFLFVVGCGGGGGGGGGGGWCGLVLRVGCARRLLLPRNDVFRQEEEEVFVEHGGHGF